jgi:pyruvate kinase
MKTLRKTKIICTMGPAVDDLDKLKALLAAGMNIARFNFSHGTHEDHAKRIALVRQASEEAGIPVALLLDTKGPEIRTGLVKDDGKITLENGKQIVLTSDEVEGTAERLSISYKTLPQEVRPGNRILVADGLIDLEVVSSDPKNITCVVRAGGVIGSRKNVNVPGVKTKLPAVTEKDVQDILFGIQQNMDFIAASFIRKHTDVLEIQNLLSQHRSPIRVVAKIEDQEGLDNIDEIIRVSYGIMVARGDLGVQLPPEAIPLAQKRIISKCNQAFRPVITATQMLESMINNPQPTRAETNDVANAIFDGTDAVMLSGETANGKYPVRAVETMNNVALTIEASPEYQKRCKDYFFLHADTKEISNAVARSASLLASDIGASAMITPTLRGNTPRLISSFRPDYKVIAATTNETVYRQLLLHWGVFPILTEFVNDSELMIQNAIRLSLHNGLVQKLDRIVTVAGIPLNSPMMINTVKVHFLGNILSRGARGVGHQTSGKITKAASADEARHLLSLSKVDILVLPTITEDMADILPQVKGCILETRSRMAIEAIHKANPEIAIVADVERALEQFENGQYVSIDGVEKIVYEGLIQA